MNVFRRWTSSGTLQHYWPTVRGEFSEGFVRFCETELNLTVDGPEVSWLKKADQSGVKFENFEKAVTELDKEFKLEWPDIISHEVGEEPLTLTTMFKHARAFPPPGLVERFGAGLIVPGGQDQDLDRGTAEPSHYGVILAWEATDGVIELVVWVRGAYRTLGFGESIAKELELLKDELKANSPGGYVLRTRYPSDGQSKVKKRWQSNLWSDFFQDRGFHRQESHTSGQDLDTFIYRDEPT